LAIVATLTATGPADIMRTVSVAGASNGALSIDATGVLIGLLN
jgi:hypothetical protein